jgi:hypothetical protein
MLDLILLLALAAALIVVAARAFAHPSGVYWRSAAGVVLTAVAAAGLWQLASPWISNAAGLGALAIWLMIVGVSVLVAAVACAAATARHVADALGAR